MSSLSSAPDIASVCWLSTHVPLKQSLLTYQSIGYSSGNWCVVGSIDNAIVDSRQSIKVSALQQFSVLFLFCVRNTRNWQRTLTVNPRIIISEFAEREDGLYRGGIRAAARSHDNIAISCCQTMQASGLHQYFSTLAFGVLYTRHIARDLTDHKSTAVSDFVHL